MNHVGPEMNNQSYANQLQYEIEKLSDRLEHIAPYAPAFSATPTLDLSRISHGGTINFGTLTANVTAVTITNAGKGQRWTIIFTQNGGGGFTIAGWPSNVKLTGAAFAITGTANAKSIISFVFDGTNHLEVCRALDVR